MKTIHQNILNETSGIIVHGVNCQGKMAAGIALAIRNKYPQVYTDYIDFIEKHSREDNTRHWLLSKVIYTPVAENLTIASAFTQFNYGRDGRRYVSYDALDHAFKDISEKSKELNLCVKFPKIGCSLAGGNWSVVSAIISEQLKDVDHALYIPVENSK